MGMTLSAETYEEWQAAVSRRQKRFLVETVGPGLLAGGMAFALSRDLPRTTEWNRTDTTLEVAYLLALVADWRQTRRAMEWGCMELNPVLGKTPDLQRVDTYFALAALQHVLLSHYLPRHLRRGYQVGSLTFQVAVVRHNVQASLRLAW